MKQFSQLVVVVLLSFSAVAQTSFRIQKFCEVGGQNVVTQGLNSVTHVQRSFPKCTVTVFLSGTTTIAPIYSDQLSTPTPLANPFTANVDGSFGFYVSNSACYDVVTSGGNPGDTIPSPFTYSNICSGSGSGGGCVGANGDLCAANGTGGLQSDPLSLTDFSGDLSSQSYTALGPHNGEISLTTDGVVPPAALPVNTVSFIPPNVIPSPYRINLPPAPGTDGQLLTQQSHSTDSSGTKNIFLNWGNAGGGGCTPTGGTSAVQSNRPSGTCYGDQNFVYFQSANEVQIGQGGSLGNGGQLLINDVLTGSLFTTGSEITLTADGSNGSGDAGGMQTFLTDAGWPGPGQMNPIGNFEQVTSTLGGNAEGYEADVQGNNITPANSLVSFFGSASRAYVKGYGVDIGDFSNASSESAAFRAEPQQNGSGTHYAFKAEEAHVTGGLNDLMWAVTQKGSIRTINCTSSAAPAACNDANTGFGAQAGSVVIAAAAVTVTVNDANVTANSDIIVSRDNSLGTRLSVTCNTQSSLVLGMPYVSARTAGTSFTITTDVAPTANPLCLSFTIVN